MQQFLTPKQALKIIWNIEYLNDGFRRKYPDGGPCQQHLNSSNISLSMSSLFMWTLLQGQCFESVSSFAWTFSGSLRWTATNKFVCFKCKVRCGSHPNSREYAIAAPGIESRKF